MPRVIAFNGSPRKQWNTATLLDSALQGAAEAGADTELVHLYDVDFKGCVSCFACKTRANARTGRCFYRDGLTPALELVKDADALVFGSPIYLGAETGEMRSFLERLVFPYITYTESHESVFPRRIPVGLIYTMNVPEEAVAGGVFPIGQHLELMENFLGRTFGSAESLYCCDTLQFDDYGKMYAPVFDAAAKARRREEVFPHDCARARDLGRRLAQGLATP